MVGPVSPARLWLLRALTLLVVLVSVEGMARVFRAFVPPLEVGFGYPSGLYSWDPWCEYRCTPGFRGFFRGERHADIPIRINRAGYRDEEFTLARTPGRRRVAFLGDSVTFGAGVRAEQRFSDRLRDEGSAVLGPLETQNFAINDYSAYHYAKLARHVVPAYDPDQVVLGLCLNDLEPKERSWPRKHVAAPDGSFVGEYLDPERRPRLRTRELFALVSVTAELEKRWRYRDPWRAWMRQIGAEWEDAALRERLRGQLAEIRDALAPRPLLVLVLPEAHDVADPARFGGPRRAALALVDALALARLDLFEDFRRDADPASLFLEHDSIHLSPRGHALVAARLAEWLASQ